MEGASRCRSGADSGRDASPAAGRGQPSTGDALDAGGRRAALRARCAAAARARRARRCARRGARPSSQRISRTPRKARSTARASGSSRGPRLPARDLGVERLGERGEQRLAPPPPRRARSDGEPFEQRARAARAARWACRGSPLAASAAASRSARSATQRLGQRRPAVLPGAGERLLERWRALRRFAACRRAALRFLRQRRSEPSLLAQMARAICARPSRS